MKINFRKKFKTYWQGFLGMFTEVSFTGLLLLFWLGITFLLIKAAVK